MDGLHQAVAREGLSVIFVNLGESRSTVARATSAHRFTAPVLLDTSGAAARAYGVTGTPSVFIIGRDGTVLGSAAGPRPWTDASARALLEALVRGGPTGTLTRRTPFTSTGPARSD
jgi:peroxiredoxin